VSKGGMISSLLRLLKAGLYFTAVRRQYFVSDRFAKQQALPRPFPRHRESRVPA